MAFDRNLEEQLELADIQGDVLIGLQKDAELFVGFVIADVAKFKRFLGGLGVTSAKDVKRADARIAAFRANGGVGHLDIRGVNISFTIDGLSKLGAPGLGSIADAAFTDGLAARSPALNDPPTGPGALQNWLVGNGTGPLDGMMLLTGKDLATVRAMFGDIDLSAGPGTWVPFFTGEGVTRLNDRGHEHFGFLDGVSQPAIRGRIDATVPDANFLNQTRDPVNHPDQGLPGADLHFPGAFVFGYQGQNPADMNLPGAVVEGGQAWMRNGSYMVYRRLEQLVPEFDRFVAQTAHDHGETEAVIGARMVGRFKSGWPVIGRGGNDPAAGTDEPANGTDEMTNNAFEFGDDANGAKCPFSAHIRKTYPRDDATPGGEDDTQTHRIFRAGIPFGPEVSPAEAASGMSHFSRGLMFVCYQTSIVDQFEFITNTWVNNREFLVEETGEDPILGQAPGEHRERIVAGVTAPPPGGKVAIPTDFIRPTGGGYFFVPSLSTIANVLA